jgi:tRNA(fMet)-specific endonuclease VapC
MKYLLDTNIVSYWMRGNDEIIQKIAEKSTSDLSISLITYAEICYGIEKSAHRKKERKEKLNSIVTLIDIIQMDIQAAHHYANIRVYLENLGTVISERDLQIASTAQSNGLKLVTHNVKEFKRIPDLSVEDWC